MFQKTKNSIADFFALVRAGRLLLKPQQVTCSAYIVFFFNCKNTHKVSFPIAPFGLYSCGSLPFCVWSLKTRLLSKSSKVMLVSVFDLFFVLTCRRLCTGYTKKIIKNFMCFFFSSHSLLGITQCQPKKKKIREKKKGIGCYMTEDTIRDNEGVLVSTNTWDYHVPMATTIPEQVFFFFKNATKWKRTNHLYVEKKSSMWQFWRIMRLRRVKSTSLKWWVKPRLSWRSRFRWRPRFEVQIRTGR